MEPVSERYAPISDYGLIGDCHTSALVSRHGSVDWFCPDRFDRSSVFAALLDAIHGGSWSIRPVSADVRAVQRYLPNTNVLETLFETSTGTARVIDFFAVPPSGPPKVPDTGSTLIRIVEGVEGRVDFASHFVPRFDYGAIEPDIELGSESLMCRGGTQSVILSHPDHVRFSADGAARFVAALDEPHAFTCSSLETAGLVWRGAHQALRDTCAYWTRWASQCTYTGPHREAVTRSALVLKLLTYAPTGASVAAPTTSLPEWVPGQRNWDYRYTWLRDSSMMAAALHRLGYRDESDAWLQWMVRHVSRSLKDGRLAIMYSIEGAPVPSERELSHLEGYRGCTPVRIGNGARGQVQLDVFGDMLLAIYQIVGIEEPMAEDVQDLVSRLADATEANWERADQGIWEVRSEPRQFIYSKAMCWAALDRACRLHERLPALEEKRWTHARKAVHDWLMNTGYDAQVHAFTQAEGSHLMDGANLRLVGLGLLPKGDPRLRSTVDQTQQQLSKYGLLHRYVAVNDDGVGGREGAFVLLSFWMVDALLEVGRTSQADELFEHLLSMASPVGLFGEEADHDTSQILGNYPQGYSHLALINSACNLAANP